MTAAVMRVRNNVVHKYNNMMKEILGFVSACLSLDELGLYSNVHCILYTPDPCNNLLVKCFNDIRHFMFAGESQGFGGNKRACMCCSDTYCMVSRDPILTTLRPSKSYIP